MSYLVSFELIIPNSINQFYILVNFAVNHFYGAVEAKT